MKEWEKFEDEIKDYLEDALKIIEITQGIPVQVNFTRRFVPEFQELSKTVSDYGAFIGGTGVYGKGFLHNGSHMIDLLRLIVGEITVINSLGEVFDYTLEDATLTALIEFESGGNFFLRGIDSRHYSIFELDLYYTNGRVKVLDGGWLIRMERVVPSAKYSGYLNLGQTMEIKTGMDNALTNLYFNSICHLTNNSSLLSPIDTVFNEIIYVK